MAKPSPVLQALRRMAIAFPSWKVDPETIKVWCEELADIAPERVVTAIRHSIATSKSDFAPTIAQIRELADPLRVGEARERGMWATAERLELIDSETKRLRTSGDD